MENGKGLRKLAEGSDQQAILVLVKSALSSLRDLDIMLTDVDPLQVFPEGLVGKGNFEMSIGEIQDILADSTSGLEKIVYAFKTNHLVVQDSGGSGFFTDDAYSKDTTLSEPKPDDSQDTSEEPDEMQPLEGEPSAADLMGELLKRTPIEDDVEFRF